MFATRGCPSLKSNTRHAVTHSFGTPASNFGPAAAVTELPDSRQKTGGSLARGNRRLTYSFVFGFAVASTGPSFVASIILPLVFSLPVMKAFWPSIIQNFSTPAAFLIWRRWSAISSEFNLASDWG